MNYKQHYVPVLLESKVTGSKPVKVWLENIPVALVRNGNKIHAYEDFCPHRGAPLSEGHVRQGTIVCKYHGWEFSMEGENLNVPVKNDRVNCKLKSFFVKIKYGIVWISSNQDAFLPVLDESSPAFTLNGNIKAGLLNTLENFLEGSHTHFVHDGLIRSKKTSRQQIQASLVPNETGFSVHYQTEPPKGLITLFTPPKFRNLRAVSTYTYPSISVLEYWNREDQLVARIEGILSEQNGKVNYLARIFIHAGALTSLAKILMRPLFKKVIAQDKMILEMQEKNLGQFKEHMFFSDATDVVGIELNHWLNAKDKIKKEKSNFIVYW